MVQKTTPSKLPYYLSVMLPLGTKGNTHNPKVYANLCQNVCKTSINNEMQILRMVMFQIKWCTKQKIFSVQGVLFVERTDIGTPGNTN